MKTSIKLNKYIILSLTCFAFLSCGKLKGEFAYKYKYDDHYKKLPTARLEIKNTEQLEWVYIFGKVTSEHNIGIIIMKKEIVWVDIKTASDYIDKDKNAIYGTIENLKDGDYYLLISDLSNQVVVDKLYFTIYSEQDD